MAEKLETARAEFEKDKTDMESLTAELEDRKAEVELEVNTVESQLATLQAEHDMLAPQVAELQAKAAELTPAVQILEGTVEKLELAKGEIEQEIAESTGLANQMVDKVETFTKMYLEKEELVKAANLKLETKNVELESAEAQLADLEVAYKARISEQKGDNVLLEPQQLIQDLVIE